MKVLLILNKKTETGKCHGDVFDDRNVDDDDEDNLP